jgi:hypothetical protein
VDDVEEVVDARGLVHPIQLPQPLEDLAVELVGEVEDVVSGGVERVKECATA